MENCGSVIRAPVAKAGGPGFDSGGSLGFFFFQLDEGSVHGSLVQCGCFQHRYEWGGPMHGALVQFSYY